MRARKEPQELHRKPVRTQGPSQQFPEVNSKLRIFNFGNGHPVLRARSSGRSHRRRFSEPDQRIGVEENAKAVVASSGDGHLFQARCPSCFLHLGIPPASNVDLTTAPFRASPDSTVSR